MELKPDDVIAACADALAKMDDVQGSGKFAALEEAVNKVISIKENPAEAGAFLLEIINKTTKEIVED